MFLPQFVLQGLDFVLRGWNFSFCILGPKGLVHSALLPLAQYWGWGKLAQMLVMRVMGSWVRLVLNAWAVPLFVGFLGGSMRPSSFWHVARRFGMCKTSEYSQREVQCVHQVRS